MLVVSIVFSEWLTWHSTRDLSEVGDHFSSRDHASKLQEKLQWKCPPADVAKQWTKLLKLH
eukprot:2792888-Amphidinium_carterae.1